MFIALIRQRANSKSGSAKTFRTLTETNKLMDWRWVGGYGRSVVARLLKCYCGLLMIQLLLKDLRMIDIMWPGRASAMSAHSEALNRQTIELRIIMLFDKRFPLSYRTAISTNYFAALTKQVLAVNVTSSRFFLLQSVCNNSAILPAAATVIITAFY